MIFWLSLQIFQYMFHTTITGDALQLLHVFGWLELLIEVTVLIVAVVLVVSKWVRNEDIL